MKKIIFAFLLTVFTTVLFCVPSQAAWLSSEAPVLKYGSTGNYVTQLQQDLNTLGYGLSTDGSFGPATLNAVKDYQAQMGLEVDGSVGPATKSSIISTINSFESSTSIQIPGTAAITRGNTGIRVRFLQKMLCLLGYPVDIDGSFGGATYEAVRSFQSDYGITVDGSCGPETIRYINGAILGTYSPKPVQTEPPITTTVPETTTTPVTTTTTVAAITTTPVTTTTPAATTTTTYETTTAPVTVSEPEKIAEEKTTYIEEVIPEETTGKTTEETTEPEETMTVQETLPEIITDPRIDAGSALKYGSRGDRVKQLQRCLVYLGWELEIDGSFGNATRNAVKEFQQKYGLSVDGSCGPATRAKINEVCENTIYAMSINTDKESKICAVGGTISLSVKYEPSKANTGKTVQWSSSNKAVATVDKDGNVKGVSAGNANITATFRAKDGFTFKKVFKLTVKVIKPQSIRIVHEPIGKLSEEIIPEGYSVKLSAEIKPDNAAATVKWKSSAPEYLKVDSDGTVTGIKEAPGNAEAGSVLQPGVITITATTDNGVKATKMFRVVEYEPKSVELKLGGKIVKNKDTYTIDSGERVKIEKSFEPFYAVSDLYFEVGDERIAEVVGSKLKAITSGETTVICKARNSKVSIQFSVKVRDSEAKIEEEFRQIRDKMYQSTTSYDGHCSAFVKEKLLAMGIFAGTPDLSVYYAKNWRDELEKEYGNGSKTSGGYSVKTYDGNGKTVKEWLNYLCDQGYDRNILICFHQASKKSKYPYAGHVVVINYIKGDTVYYSDSYASYGKKEGEMTKCTISEFSQRYATYSRDYNGMPRGVAVFVK